MLSSVRRPTVVLSIAFLPVCFAACSDTRPLGADTATPHKTAEHSGENDAVSITTAAETPPRITILDQAAEHFAEQAAKANLEPGYVLVIGVKEGGDKIFKNGGDKRYRYTLMQTDDPVDWNKHFLVESNGIKVGVAKESARFLDGLSISLVNVDEGVRLRFDNPNVAMLIETGRSDSADDSDAPVLAPIPQTTDAPREVSGDDDRESRSVLKKSASTNSVKVESTQNNGTSSDGKTKRVASD